MENNGFSFSENEKKILLFWRKKEIFHKSLEKRKKSPLFSFYDGPPFSTGLPHYGHLLTGTIKDVIARYKTMKNYYVPRRFGWDCHGVPIEHEVEKILGKVLNHSSPDFNIKEFNQKCREVAIQYSEAWGSSLERLGRWGDINNSWRTMDLSYMESVWWVFNECFKKDFIYRGTKVVAFSTALSTPLSNFEAGQNYKEVDDPSIIVKFYSPQEKAFFLVWTTTPWTLFSNMALAINLENIYVRVQIDEGDHYILSKEVLYKWFSSDCNLSIIKEYKADELINIVYDPPFSDFIDKKTEGAFRVISGDFVSNEEGTGVVHIAPAFGEIDFYLCQKEGIPLVCPVNEQGNFTEEVKIFSGKNIKESTKEIIALLKDKKLLFYRGTIRHRYPFCWRTDTPLIYMVTDTWFFSVEKIKNVLLECNNQINWIPEYLKEGRFGKWLQGARDWAISRNRYWGTPIPIWISPSKKIHVISSIGELEDLSGQEITDLHRDTVDEISFIKDGEVYKRIEGVFDCWFDSGAMPYANIHYPFENKDLFKKTFPADFIAEGLDQTRGWFYTLSVIGAALLGSPAFKNVITNGIVLSENGSKMSKRLKNYPDPELVINKYGADALRLYFLQSGAVRGEDLKLSEEGIETILKQVVIPLYNAQSFFHLYADLYHFSSEKIASYSKEDFLLTNIDRWIISRLNTLILTIENALTSYDLSEAINPLVNFIDELTNWYIRRCRRRFWSEEDSLDRRAAFFTLYKAIFSLSKIIAPFTPFTAETIYQKLKLSTCEESVHLTLFPSINEEEQDIVLESHMKAVRTVVSMGHALRKEKRLKVRQPLSIFYIVCNDKQIINYLEEESPLIKEELNIKEVHFYKENPSFINLIIKPNFRTLGKKVGKYLPKVQEMLTMLSEKEKLLLEQDNPITLNIEDFKIEITSNDVLISREAKEGFSAVTEGDYTVILDSHLTQELIEEGNARELVNKINTTRRTLGLYVSDRINLVLNTSSFIEEIIKKYKGYISSEVLAESIEFSSILNKTSWDINGETVYFEINKGK